jgi:flagellar biosynthesis protein FliR
MNVFVLGFPVKILLSLGLVALTLPLLPNVLERLVRTAVRSGSAVMGAFPT